jgi:hypothetical protein
VLLIIYSHSTCQSNQKVYFQECWERRDDSKQFPELTPEYPLHQIYGCQRIPKSVTLVTLILCAAVGFATAILPRLSLTDNPTIWIHSRKFFCQSFSSKRVAFNSIMLSGIQGFLFEHHFLEQWNTLNEIRGPRGIIL